MTENITTIAKLIQHWIGNKFQSENIILGHEMISISDEDYGTFTSFITKPFENKKDYYKFIHHSDIKQNEIYSYCLSIFEDPNSFVNNSEKISKHLYEAGVLPNIKAGDLLVAFMEDITVDGITTDAVAIIKIERKVPFFKLDIKDNSPSLELLHGVNLQKIDKACLVLQLNIEDGLKILTIDNNNYDTNYWNRDFLNIEPLKDEYHQTQNLLNLTKDFVIKQMPADFDVSKADQVELLNKSVDYFKKHTHFNENEFTNEVLGNDEYAANSFKKFKSDYEMEKNLEELNDFSISSHAVKKESKTFKNVIKLDKNFDVYIHGDNSLLERGVDPKSGKNFYKIYFDNES